MKRSYRKRRGQECPCSRLFPRAASDKNLALCVPVTCDLVQPRPNLQIRVRSTSSPHQLQLFPLLLEDTTCCRANFIQKTFEAARGHWRPGCVPRQIVAEFSLRTVSVGLCCRALYVNLSLSLPRRAEPRLQFAN